MERSSRKRALRWTIALATALIAVAAIAAPPEVKTPDFNHTVHQKAGLGMASCDACHAGTTADGKLKFPGTDHKPCRNDACHAMEFRKRDSQLCFTCHLKNEPWVDNPTKPTLVRVSGSVPEFVVAFSHKAHLDRGGGQGTALSGCDNCHYRQSGGQAPVIPPGLLAPSHVQCASCHEATAKPKMTECGSCHGFDSGSPRAAGGGASSEWRVNAKFRHETHRTDVRTSEPLDCQSCHPNVIEVGPGQTPGRPSMATCAEICHDGRTAFKATGFSCVRCHGVAPASSREESMK